MSRFGVSPARPRWTARVALAALTLLPASAASAQEFDGWTSCPTFLAQPVAASLGIPAGLCERYTFVRGTSASSGSEQLYLITHTSAPVRLSSGDALVFLDVESAIPTFNFAVDLGGPRVADVLALWRLRRALGSPAALPVAAFTSPATLQVELLVDAQFFELARRLGVFFPVQDGTAAFTGLAVVRVPELNMLLFSAQLTETGRRFFRTFRDQGIAGLEALLAWRVVHRFGNGEVEAISTGWFPCVRAGPRITTDAQLAQIDPALLLAPIDLSNMTQMVDCE